MTQDVKLDRLISELKRESTFLANQKTLLVKSDIEAIIAALERLKAIDEAPDPLGHALNSGDGSYRP